MVDGGKNADSSYHDEGQLQNLKITHIRKIYIHKRAVGCVNSCCRLLEFFSLERTSAGMESYLRLPFGNN